MKFRNEATMRPPQSPGREKKEDWREMRVTKLFYLKPRARNIPYW